MTRASGAPRPFWDEDMEPARRADCVRRVWESLARLEAEPRTFLFVPDPPTPFDLCPPRLPEDVQTLTWGVSGCAVWTGEERVARALIAPMFELRADWLYIIAIARVGESPTLQEKDLAAWVSDLVGGESHTEVPLHVLLAFEWGDFAPPPVSSRELPD